MIPGEDNEKRTDRGWHEYQPWICKDIVPNFSRPIQPSNGIDLILRSAVEEAEVKVAVCVVDGLISVAGVEYGVYDQIGERKKVARKSSGMGDEPVPT